MVMIGRCFNLRNRGFAWESTSNALIPVPFSEVVRYNMERLNYTAFSSTVFSCMTLTTTTLFGRGASWTMQTVSFIV